MRAIGTRSGTAVAGIASVAFGIALADDQLPAGLAAVAFGILVLVVATRRELGDFATVQHRYTASAAYRLVPMTILAVLAVCLVASWVVDGSDRGRFFGALGLVAAAPGVGWMVDVWWVRLSSRRRDRSPAGAPGSRR